MEWNTGQLMIGAEARSREERANHWPGLIVFVLFARVVQAAQLYTSTQIMCGCWAWHALLSRPDSARFCLLVRVVQQVLHVS